MNGTIISYTTGCKQFKAKSCFQVLEALLLLGLAALFTKLYGMKGGAAAYASAALLTGPLYIWWVCRDTQKEEKKELSKTLPAGWFSLIGLVSAITFFQMLLMHTSSIILMYLRGAESNAVFNIAQPVAQIFLSLMVFHQVFLPISVEMVQKKEFGKLRLYAGFGIIITLAILPVLYILLSCTSHWVISLLFSKAYADQAEMPTIILITGFLFNALGSFITQIMIAMKKMTLLLWGLVLTLLINIVCNFILIRRMDVNGASWATLLSYLFFSIFVIAAFYHTLSKEVQVKTS